MRLGWLCGFCFLCFQTEDFSTQNTTCHLWSPVQYRVLQISWERSGRETQLGAYISRHTGAETGYARQEVFQGNFWESCRGLYVHMGQNILKLLCHLFIWCNNIKTALFLTCAFHIFVYSNFYTENKQDPELNSYSHLFV